jgi:hypothetical protein
MKQLISKVLLDLFTLHLLIFFTDEDQPVKVNPKAIQKAAKTRDLSELSDHLQTFKLTRSDILCFDGLYKHLYITTESAKNINIQTNIDNAINIVNKFKGQNASLILAVKEYRKLYGTGLKASKMMIDRAIVLIYEEKLQSANADINELLPTFWMTCKGSQAQMASKVSEYYKITTEDALPIVTEYVKRHHQLSDKVSSFYKGRDYETANNICNIRYNYCSRTMTVVFGESIAEGNARKYDMCKNKWERFTRVIKGGDSVGTFLHQHVYGKADKVFHNICRRISESGVCNISNYPNATHYAVLPNEEERFDLYLYDRGIIVKCLEDLCYSEYKLLLEPF